MRFIRLYRLLAGSCLTAMLLLSPLQASAYTMWNQNLGSVPSNTSRALDLYKAVQSAISANPVQYYANYVAHQNILRKINGPADTINDRINDFARSMVPTTALLAPTVVRSTLDQNQNLLSANLTGILFNVTRPDPSDHTGLDSPWRSWVNPYGTYEEYDAADSSFKDIDVRSGGVNAGIGLRIGDAKGLGASLGLSFNYTHGYMNGSNQDAYYDSFGLMGGLRTTGLIPDCPVSPWVELIGGYSFTAFEQDRTDYIGREHTGDFDMHAIRLGVAIGQDFALSETLRFTPIIGLDYTFSAQDSFTEDSKNGLEMRMSSDEMSSLRGKIGGEMEMTSGDFSAGLRAFYRYEFLDEQIELDTRFPNLSQFEYTAKGPDYDQSSGEVGVNASYRLDDAMSLGAGYDFVTADDYTGHRVNVQFRLTF